MRQRQRETERERREVKIERWERKREGETIKLPVVYGWKGRASRAERERIKKEGKKGWTRTVTEMKNKMLHMMHLARRAAHVYAPPLMRCYVWPREKKLPAGRRYARFYELSPTFDTCIAAQVQSKRPLGE